MPWLAASWVVAPVVERLSEQELLTGDFLQRLGRYFEKEGRISRFPGSRRPRSDYDLQGRQVCVAGIDLRGLSVENLMCPSAIRFRGTDKLSGRSSLVLASEAKLRKSAWF
jgi:hypothetical protein